MTVTNSNGYGLQAPNNVTLQAGSSTFSVANATASNVVQGLYLTGKISGGTITKSGNGTLVLGNSANDFTGDITVNQGVLSVASNGALGNVALFNNATNSFGQRRETVQACRSTHSPSGTINPVSSATGMNCSGEIRPRTGWCQRTSASKPTISPLDPT